MRERQIRGGGWVVAPSQNIAQEVCDGKRVSRVINIAAIF
jgi:hypothetical protein